MAVALIFTSTFMFIFISSLAAIAQAQAYTEKLLFSFVGDDGDVPLAGLVRDAAGNLYGTTSSGGLHQNGTVFRLDPFGNYTVLYAFTGGADGGIPQSNLLLDSGGNLFGTTTTGGTYNYGTLFELSADGTEKVLHSYGNGSDGREPYSGLIRDQAGNFYGTTVIGGSHQFGTVFRVTPFGEETVLYSFTNGKDGLQPIAGLVLDQSGNLYGCAQYGGAFGGGTLFKLSPSGNLTVLYSFGSKSGLYPTGIIRDPSGNFYGTTRSGGSHSDGTAFRVSASGNAAVLHNFSGGTDGEYPYAPLIRDSVGNLYGTTYGGGSGNWGTVFEINSSGKENVLYAFTASPDGTAPVASLIRDSAGNLYGTTKYGGLGGTLFEISPAK
jgi:uncharacterized repeat protein (TIGR03803 family)